MFRILPALRGQAHGGLCRLDGHGHILHALPQLLCQLGEGGLGAAQLHGVFPRCLHPHAQLFQRAAYLDGAAFPEQLFDLAQDDRHGISGKAHAALRVEVVAGFDQPHTARTVKVIVFDAPSAEPPGAGMHQPQILCDECFPPGLVRYHTPCPPFFLCRRAGRQPLDQHHLGALTRP